MTKDEFIYDLLCATGFDGPGYMHPLEQPRPKRRPVKAGDSDIFWSYKVKDVAESILPKEAEDIRWMIEEYRISLFDQSQKTLYSVSDKRIRKKMEEIREQSLAVK